MCAATDMDLVPVARGEHGSYLEVDLEGSDAEATFGTHGKSLDALQYLANLIVARRVGMDVRVILDAAGYRERRAQVLTDRSRTAWPISSSVRLTCCSMGPYPPLRSPLAAGVAAGGEHPNRKPPM